MALNWEAAKRRDALREGHAEARNEAAVAKRAKARAGAKAPSRKQLDYLSSLARQIGIERPTAQSAYVASAEIDRLKNMLSVKGGAATT